MRVRQQATAAAAILATLAALTAGCGDNGTADAAQVGCRVHAFNRLRAGIAIKYYNRGVLGTRQQIERRLGKNASFFDAKGRIIPYDRENVYQQTSMNKWVFSPRVQRVAGKEMERAAEDFDPDC
jgi:hypothetical protein